MLRAGLLQGPAQEQQWLALRVLQGRLMLVIGASLLYCQKAAWLKIVVALHHLPTPGL
jgi:hypothetical protein